MYMKTNVIGLHLLGMYALGENAFKCTKIFYQLLRVVCFTFFTVTIVLCLLDIHYREEYVFIDVASNILSTVIFSACINRILFFYYYDYKIRDIVISMNKIFRDQSETCLQEKTDQSSRNLAKYLCIGWHFTAFFTGQFFAILPLILIKILGKTLPIPAWYPYDWKKNVNYSLTMITQSITQFLMGFAYSNSDMFFMCSIILTTGQFKILGWEFKHIFQTALKKSGYSENEIEKFNEFLGSNQNIDFKRDGLLSSQKFKDDLYRSLISCIQRHQILLKFCDKLQDFFSGFLLYDIFFHMLVIVFIAFTLVVAKDFTKYVVLSEYLATALFDLFLTTYFAQLLSDESSYILDQLYEAPWYLCTDTKFRSTFTMVQMRSKKYVEPRAANYMAFNLHLFIITCKTAASYFAVLRQVTENQ